MTSEAKHPRCLLVSLVAGCAVLAGCGAPDRATGTVVFDGRPVETGVIVFQPLRRSAAAQGSLIEGGKYVVECGAGPHRVEIRGTRPMDESRVPRTMPRLGGAPINEDSIPAAFNTESTLEVEVKAGGPNVFDFDLKSPGPAR